MRETGEAMGISAKVINRIQGEMKRYQSVLSALQKRDVSEADTVTVVNDMLADVCGYDKYHEVTGQYAIRGTYVDLAVKVDDAVRFLIEVKAIGTELKDGHIKQAIDYAANVGLEWVVLTNGAVWRIYKVHFGQPIEKILVCDVDVLACAPKSDSVADCFGHLSREAFSKDAMASLLHQKQVTNKFTVAALLTSDAVVDGMRKEIRRLSGVRVEPDYLRNMLTEDVIKRELIDSDEAKAAVQNLKRMNRSVSKKKAPTNEPIVVAPVAEAASAALPRAAAVEAAADQVS